MNWHKDHPLELVDGETPSASAALTDYALLGETRSLSQLALEYQSRPKVGPKKPPTRQLSQLKTWSAQYDWVARVAAHDELRRAALRAAEQQSWVDRQLASRENTWQLAQQLREKAARMLEFPLATVERTQDTQQSADGRVEIVNKTIVMPARWGYRELVAVADLAAKLERLAVELPTERAHLLVEGLQPRDLENMSRDELELLKLQMQNAKK